MILELDVGNTRIKWRLRQLGASGALANGVLEYGENIVSVLCELPFDGVKKISLAAVLSENKKHQFVSELSKSSGVIPWSAKVTSKALGVTCAYEQPEQLGVDRWLAMIAAYYRYHSAVCIIDAGSALTIDWVDSMGFHQGGYIVPGFSMAKAALLKNTGKVRFSEKNNSKGECVWPTNTQEAVEEGLLRQAEGFLQLIKSEFLGSGNQPAKIIVAGGDASLVSSLLAADVQIYEDVVLDGLSLLAPY